jgi:hypothetical protein
MSWQAAVAEKEAVKTELINIKLARDKLDVNIQGLTSKLKGFELDNGFLRADIAKLNAKVAEVGAVPPR